MMSGEGNFSSTDINNQTRYREMEEQLNQLENEKNQLLMEANEIAEKLDEF
jgi:hypothetical protein